MCQGHAEVLRIGKLLLLIHSEFCVHSQTIAQYGQEGLEMEMDREAGESIWRIERKVYQRTGISSTRLRQKK